jgi:hypothetical protein
VEQPLEIGEAVFRANPNYELVQFDRLGEADRLRIDQSALRGAYGLLLPRRGSACDPLSVSNDAALLFFSLMEPGPLPGFALARVDDAAQITRLVADGVVEVLHEGTFVSGPQGAELLCRVPPRVANISAVALQYGQALGPMGKSELASRLYFYGRVPVSPALASRFPDEVSIDHYLGISPGGPIARALGARWQEVPTTPEARRYWRQWLTLDAEASATKYKLYVSPALDQLPEALAASASLLPSVRGVTGFKLGAGLGGMCRPDKLIIYLKEMEDVAELAARLKQALGQCRAHEPPFTASITEDGLLTWGADPPGARGETKMSWRMWIAERLAAYLAAARDAPLQALEPWQYALERLKLSGIDTTTWTPARDRWSETLATA